jgi:hypothetical protein
MALLNQTQREYYQGEDYGSYQFSSLQDIINQFMVAYVGEGKIISKASKTDVSFHAQRAMQELSFDTFKSIKSQEIELPPSLTMILPHDYVNYTCLAFVDNAGIKHRLYPINKTSNPFSIAQEPDGTYEFSDDVELLLGNSFTSAQGRIHPRWKKTHLSNVQRNGNSSAPSGYLGFGGGFNIQSDATLEALKFTHVSQPINPVNNLDHDGRVLSCWQKLDVSNMSTLRISGTVDVFNNTSTQATADAVSHSQNVPDGRVIIGVQTTPGVNNTKTKGTPQQINNNPNFISKNTIDPDLGFMEYTSDGTQQLDIDVSNHSVVYFIINSYVEVSTSETLADGVIGTTLPTQHTFVNTISEVSAVNGLSTVDLLPRDLQTNDSITWERYKSHKPNDDMNRYDDGTYDLVSGERYGLDPQYAQINGSFYIDNLKGLINFSSNVGGKTVILDYISDGLGTEEEMQVHKFAQEALYMHIMYAILSTRANIPEYIVRRYKKEKFAATRKAKLRLSNIKLEEITQVLRGKSKWIKH